MKALSYIRYCRDWLRTGVSTLSICRLSVRGGRGCLSSSSWHSTYRLSDALCCRSTPKLKYSLRLQDMPPRDTDAAIRRTGRYRASCCKFLSHSCCRRYSAACLPLLCCTNSYRNWHRLPQPHTVPLLFLRPSGNSTWRASSLPRHWYCRLPLPAEVNRMRHPTLPCCRVLEPPYTDIRLFPSLRYRFFSVLPTRRR